jgi:predicted transcriptional regulator
LDRLTENLLMALDPVAVELLLALLASPLTEAELVETIGSLGQPTCNRRLHRLKDTGLVKQERGRIHAPGRCWTIRHVDEIEALLEALLGLADAVEAENQAARKEARKRLLLSRARRLGIRSVDNAS